jgi:hypothetical protein
MTRIWSMAAAEPRLPRTSQIGRVRVRCRVGIRYAPTIGDSLTATQMQRSWYGL